MDTAAFPSTLSNGQLYGFLYEKWPSLCIQNDGSVYLGDYNAQTQHAVSGQTWLLRDGQPTDHTGHPKAYSRTAVGLTADHATLWLVLVDGKQPRYSEGVTLDELTTLMQSLGVADAINLDGGGSTTLAYRTDADRIDVLNRPVHTKIPGRERPVANHLFVHFADPAPPQ